jgi:dihydrofolate reductase
MQTAEQLQHIITTYGAVEGGKQTLARLGQLLQKSVPKVRVSAFGVSLDGYAAGPNQSLENPLGVRGPELFEWFMSTRTWKQMNGQEGGSTGTDDEWARRGMENVGAWIMGRNMFGPVRGPWTDESWMGWWGDEPPYHVPTFVLTHHPRRPLAMKGGTTFHFITEGIEAALQQAKAAANNKDIRIGGGVATVREYLRARLIDQLHLVVRPILLGSGENLFSGLDLAELGYRCSEHTSTELAMHVVLTKIA